MTSTSTDLLSTGATRLPDEGHVAAIVADVVAERAGHLFGLMGNGNVHLISRLTRRGFPFTSARHDYPGDGSV